MKPPTPDGFAEFYESVYGRPPFPWQERLAARVCGGSWPHCVALPTAAGKTACIDIAVFALACGAANAARRVFFVVDRRIVVDQAYDHAKKLADVLLKAKSGVLFDVAESLRALAGDERPLDAYALRGGMYRETAWARSPLQPTVIASTVDQVGSRLLFRGYGVSDSMKPVHAGLVGNDALILLDEAHCAKPFDQTMQAVKAYRKWAAEGETQPSFEFVSLTATPTGVAENDIERDTDADRTHPVLGKRISASKPAKLVVADKAKGKNGRGELVKVLEAQARELAKTAACVGIIVNRVATARELAAKLGDDAVLLTGRMRPLDRDRLFDEKLRPLLSNAEGTPPKFVIGTQCLEVGADFDFHALVTECASLDALRQRFGRLNRVANRDDANAVIVIRCDETETREKETDRDPIYGNSLPATWQWLNAKATDGVFDFGMAAVRAATAGVDLVPLNAPTTDAPVLLPAHLDAWVQTHPIPTPDPDPALFLHGPKQPGQPDVRVVFRDDLGYDTDDWAGVVELCPPSSSEAVAVPISVFKKWLAGDSPSDESGDVEGEAFDEEKDETPQASRAALRWRGPEKNRVVTDPAEVFPDDLFVLPCAADATALGDFPFGLTDFAEEAFQRSRDKALLRLRDVTIPEEADRDEERRVVTEAIEVLEAGLTDASPDWLRRAVKALRLPKDRDVVPHPCGGVVVTGKRRLKQFDPEFLDDDNSSYSPAREVTLCEHSRGVADHARRFAAGCGLPVEAYTLAGMYHDVGKLDPRFQAMLRQSSPRTAVGDPLAKSAQSPRTPAERKQARQVHRYPSGARHELLSAAVVSGHTSDELVLHLIATHHGSARPFAAAVEEDETANGFDVELSGQTVAYPSARQDIAGWNAELPERFWRVVRRYGWWGSAYREAVFRLADHAQSRAEQEGETFAEELSVSLPPRVAPQKWHPLALTGLDGSNPLAFLAALGTLRLADRAWRGTRLSWEVRGQWTPVLHLPKPVSEDELVTTLLERAASDRRCVTFADDVKILADEFRAFQREAQGESAEDHEFADFLSAYADPSVTIQGGPNAGKTKPTEFYFIAGLQKLLKQVQQIAAATTPAHVTKALFSPWVYDDPLDRLSLRWDPLDDLRYATRFVNPSGDNTRGRRGSVLGANRLAFEALAFFPCCALRGRLATTAFHAAERRSYFTWPVWTPAWSVGAVRSVLRGVEQKRAE